jgi:hypothetical protein
MVKQGISNVMADMILKRQTHIIHVKLHFNKSQSASFTPQVPNSRRTMYT